MCKRCKPNLDNHVPARCPGRKSPAKEHWLNFLYNDRPHSNWSNGHIDPALQLSVSTVKPDHISELLETEKITKYFKKSYKNSKSHHVNNGNNYPCKVLSCSHNLDKHVCKTYNYNNQVNKVNGQTQMLKGTKSETVDPEDHQDSDSPNNNFDSSDSE